MPLDMTSFLPALKEYYTDDAVKNMVYKKNPFLAMVPKMEEFYGKNLPIPLIYGNPQGQGAVFSKAQSKATSSSSLLKAFALTRVSDYSVAVIDNQTLEASKNNAGAFMEAATLEINGAINTLSRSLAKNIYRSGTGALGQVGTGTTTPIILKNINDVVNFEVGMTLVSAATNVVGDAMRTGEIVITGINRNTGSLAFSGTITSFALNDYLFISGDQTSASTIAASKVSGLQAWIPDSAPGATSFFGVDRSADVNRLGGLRKDFTGQPIEEALIDAGELIAREGGAPDYCFMNYNKYGELKKSLGSKVVYVDSAVSAEISFRGILIEGDVGPIRVIPDINCPSDHFFMVQLDTWKLHSLGKAVRILDQDSLQMLRMATSDGVEVRYGGYLNLGCSAPGWNLSAII